MSKCGFENVSTGLGICEGKSGIWYTWIVILCFQNNERLINWMYFHLTNQSQLAVQSIPSQKNKSWVWKGKKKKNLFHKKRTKKTAAISQKNKMSGLFKNCQHNPLHTAPPSAFSVNHRPPSKPAAKAKISPSPIQQHKNCIWTSPPLCRNKIGVSWIIWRQQYMFSNGSWCKSNYKTNNIRC